MAIVASNLYSGRVVTGDSGYPLGKAQDIVNGEKGTGTPLRASWVNDQWGFLQALLDAGNISPSGTPDQVGQSDYLDAINKIIREPFALKIFQSPTDGGLTEIQTRTVEGGEVYEVRKTSDDSLATIYSDAAGTNEIAQNGIDNKSDEDGIVQFYVDSGRYYISVGSDDEKFTTPFDIFRDKTVAFIPTDGVTPVAALIQSYIDADTTGLVLLPAPDTGKGHQLEQTITVPDNTVVRLPKKALCEVTGDHVAFALDGNFNSLQGGYFKVKSGVTNTSDMITVGIEGGGGGQRASVREVEIGYSGAHGIRISDGNAGMLENIRIVGAGLDSIHFDNTANDNNAWTFSGFIDLLAATRDNFHLAPTNGNFATAPKAHGGGSVIVAQQAGRYNAYIGSHFNELTFYSELGGEAEVYIDNALGAKGNSITTTLGTIEYSDPTQSPLVHGNVSNIVNPDASLRRMMVSPIFQNSLAVLNVSMPGQLEISQTADRQFTFELSGSSSSGHEIVMKTADTISSQLLLKPDSISSNYRNNIGEFIDGDATPDISLGNAFYCSNTSSTTITFFDGRTAGKVFYVQFDGNTEIVNSGNIKLKDGSTKTPANNEVISFMCNMKNSSPFFIEI